MSFEAAKIGCEDPELGAALEWLFVSGLLPVVVLRREVSKNETFWAHSDPWRIFSTSSRGL